MTAESRVRVYPAIVIASLLAPALLVLYLYGGPTAYLGMGVLVVPGWMVAGLLRSDAGGVAWGGLFWRLATRGSG